MNLVGTQPLVQHLLTRGGRNVLAQLIHRFRLQFLGIKLRLGVEQRILFEILFIIQRTLVIIVSQIPNSRHEYIAFEGNSQRVQDLAFQSTLRK